MKVAEHDQTVHAQISCHGEKLFKTLVSFWHLVKTERFLSDGSSAWQLFILFYRRLYKTSLGTITNLTIFSQILGTSTNIYTLSNSGNPRKSQPLNHPWSAGCSPLASGRLEKFNFKPPSCSGASSFSEGCPWLSHAIYVSFANLLHIVVEIHNQSCFHFKPNIFILDQAFSTKLRVKNKVHKKGQKNIALLLFFQRPMLLSLKLPPNRLSQNASLSESPM